MAKFRDQSFNANEVSRVAQCSSIKGDISSKGDIRVDGNVDGTIYSCGRIVIGETARLSGNILCENVDFWGMMEGDVYVKDLLTLKSDASINGNIHARRIQVEIGAQINGSCTMISEEEFDNYVAEIVVNPL